MRRINFVSLAVFVLAGTMAWAQDAPKAELSFDYSFARYAPSASYTQGHSLNGGGGRFTYNVNNWLGLAADFQGYNSNTNKFVVPPNTYFPGGAAGTASGNLFTYLFGPVLKYRWEGVRPYADLLFGAAHSSVYGNAFKQICQPVAGTCSFSSSPNGDAYAMSIGGGIDFPLNQRIDLRIGEFDYLYTRFTNQFTNAGQNNFRYLGGLNINLGQPASQPRASNAGSGGTTSGTY
ncbi:MAG TPA: outer membrane beta-barrel protein [Terracidiphilus sp.]|nr:outer membrane beta-barrel protein [Terracidiphilus sp.]